MTTQISSMMPFSILGDFGGRVVKNEKVERALIVWHLGWIVVIF